MRNQKGFTIIEGIITFVIVCIVSMFAIVIFLAIRNVVDGGNYCDMYRYAPINEVPASCIDYFFNGNGAQK